MDTTVAEVKRRLAELLEKTAAIRGQQARMRALVDEWRDQLETLEKKAPSRWAKRAIWLWFAAFYIAGQFSITAGAIVGLTGVYAWIGSGPLTTGFGVAIVGVLGLAAFQFRKRKRMHYGAFEVGASLGSASLVLAQPTKGAIETAALGVVPLAVEI